MITLELTLMERIYFTKDKEVGEKVRVYKRPGDKEYDEREIKENASERIS